MSTTAEAPPVVDPNAIVYDEEGRPIFHRDQWPKDKSPVKGRIHIRLKLVSVENQQEYMQTFDKHTPMLDVHSKYWKELLEETIRWLQSKRGRFYLIEATAWLQQRNRQTGQLVLALQDQISADVRERLDLPRDGTQITLHALPFEQMNLQRQMQGLPPLPDPLAGVGNIPNISTGIGGAPSPFN